MDIHEFDDPTAETPQGMYMAEGDDSGMDDDYDQTNEDDSTSTTGSSGDDTIDLEAGGQTTTYEVTEDIDGDGDADAAVIELDDGRTVLLADSDHDGVADQAAMLEDGEVVDTAEYDESSGEWEQGRTGSGSGSGSGSTDYDETSTTSTSGDDEDERGTDYDDSGGSSGLDTPGTGTPEEITYESQGYSRDLTATVDLDNDGEGDTAIVQGDAGRVAITDTDGDGTADTAALLDESGQVMETAHVDPSTGEWVSGPGADNPYEDYEAMPTSATDGPGSTTTSSAPSGGGDVGGAPQGASQDIIVEAGGQVSELEATVDVDRDGVSETAVVQGSDGTQIAFSDSDGDGEADRAAVFDAQGNLVGTAHYNPATGEWTDDSGSRAPVG